MKHQMGKLRIVWVSIWFLKELLGQDGLLFEWAEIRQKSFWRRENLVIDGKGFGRRLSKNRKFIGRGGCWTWQC